MRLFVSLPIIGQLEQQLKTLPRKGLNAEWVHPKDYHITLRYLGDADIEQLEDIKQSLKRIKTKSFGIEIEGLSHFDAKNGAILYANVQSKRKITALAAEINLKMQRNGFEMPNKPFVPHITVAKMVSARDLNGYLRANNKKIRASWRASGFELVESGDLADNMPRYKILQRYDLQ